MFKLRAFPLLLLISCLLFAGCSSDRNPMMSPSFDLTRVAQAPTLSIPEGATLQAATFYIHVAGPSNQVVNNHRVTADWDEATITWNNFGGAYDPAIEGSFVADAVDWRSTDITALVQAWLDGTYANYGILLDQDVINWPRGIYYSSEASTNPPYLEVCYIAATGEQCEQIIPAGDAYINEYHPDENYGETEALFTGWAADNNLEKQSLVKFDLEVTPPPDSGCTRTIGYWKNWAGFGPQDDMVTALLPIWLGTPGGSESLEVTDAGMAVDILEMKTYGRPNNGITKLYAQLLGAKLNFASGATGSVVAETVADADEFLADYNWTDWRSFEIIQRKVILAWQTSLDMYNNGDIGPGHCDDVEYDD